MKFLQNKKILGISLFLLFLSNQLLAQNNITGRLLDFQGIWVNRSDDRNALTYWVISKNSLKEIIILNSNIYTSKSLIGFSDLPDLENINDNSFSSKLKNDGTFFYIASKLKNGKYGLIQYRVAEVDSFSFTITGSQPIEYEKLKDLPKEIKKYF
jgi:hypothetical protein